MDKTFAIVILCILILVLYCTKNTEHLEDRSSSYIRLYEGFGLKKLSYEFYPDEGGNYIKQILKVNLKSIDINLTELGNKYDEIRRIELWSISGGGNISSSESGFYDSYLEPESALRANSAKYQKIIRILPGNHVKLDLTFPIKKILIIATI